MNVSEDKKLCNFSLVLLSKLHCDYLLLNRVCYKVKNQFRRQKQFQYAIQYKKILKKIFNISKSNVCLKKNDKILEEYVSSEYIQKEKIKNIIDLLTKMGLVIEEMLKLKLYLSYSIVMLGIISRAHSIFEYFLINEEKIKNSFNNVKKQKDTI